MNSTTDDRCLSENWHCRAAAHSRCTRLRSWMRLCCGTLSADCIRNALSALA
jgi:hypothetical protein